MKQTAKRQWFVKMLTSLMILGALMPATVMANDRYWVSDTGNWSNGEKWNTAWDGSGTSGIPQTNDSARMNATASAIIYYDVASTSLQFLSLSDNITFSQAYPTSVLTVQNFQMDGYAPTMPV